MLDLSISWLFVQAECSGNGTAVRSAQELGIDEMYLDDGRDVCGPECLFSISWGMVIHKKINDQEYAFKLGSRCAPDDLFDETILRRYNDNLKAGQCFEAGPVRPDSYEYRSSLHNQKSLFGRVEVTTETIEKKVDGNWSPVATFGTKTVHAITPISAFLSDINAVSCGFGAIQSSGGASK